MKTDVSIPDDILEQAERLARETHRSRNEILSDALREYLARHSPDEVTEAMNRVSTQFGDRENDFAAAASARVLENVEW